MLLYKRNYVCEEETIIFDIRKEMRKEMRKVGKYAQKMIIHFVDILSNKYFAKT